MWYLIPVSIILLILILLSVMITKTILIKEKPQALKNKLGFSCDIDTSVKRFSKLIQCVTTSGNSIEFDKFKNLLKEFYPEIHSKADFDIVGENGLFFRIKGENSNRSIILMSHYDVVPAIDEDWSYPPFSGSIIDGKIYGRGTLDTKCTLAAVMESLECMLVQNKIPKTDIYLCFGGDEETTGLDAKAMAALLKSRGIYPELILDEGGAVLDGGIVGMKVPCALIGIAEKGYMDVEFIARSKGGHTSLPTKNNPMTNIAEVIKRLNKNPFKVKISEPVKVMMLSVAKYASFRYSFIFCNYKFFRTILTKFVAKATPEISALTRTIGSITMIEGSSAPNVIPEKVCAVGNFRILSESSIEETLGIIKNVLKGLPVEINVLESFEPSKISKTDSKSFAVLSQVIEKTFSAAAIPYLMIAGSDSRSYSNISDNIYRFSPIMLNENARKTIHGIDEFIEIESYIRVIKFYTSLLTEYFN